MKHLAVIFAWVSFSCEAPPVFPGADKRQNARPARIDGTLVASTSARGNAVVLLFDASRPPPPTGTGRPLTFALVPAKTLFGQVRDLDTGPFTAPFSFSLVNPGQYLIRAFIDSNEDWIPWYGVTNEVNAGDVGGAALDSLTRGFAVIEVPSSQDGTPQPAIDIPVTIADTARVGVDRPAFEVALPMAAAALEEVELKTTPLALELRVRPISEGAISQARPVFLARFIDDNGDGVPDDANQDGIPDLWPRVVVRKMANEGAGNNPLADENDLDRNGVIDDTGADYEHLNPMTGAAIPPDGAPDVVVLAAGLNAAELAPQLLDSMGRVKPMPTPLTRLPIVIRPLALDATDSRRPVPLKTLPEGRYAVTVIQQTGQTWRVPNELRSGLAPRVGLPTVASQSFVVSVGSRP